MFCRHLAAAEGCYSVVEWLLTEGKCIPNPVDRFKRTPLEVCCTAVKQCAAPVLIRPHHDSSLLPAPHAAEHSQSSAHS